MTPIEAAARAISDADAVDGCEDPTLYWEKLTEYRKDVYLSYAAAVIAAYTKAVSSEAVGVNRETIASFMAEKAAMSSHNSGGLTADDYLKFGIFHNMADDLLQRLIFLPQPAVRVKPLVWENAWFGSDDDIPGWKADTPFGRVSASVAGQRDENGNSYEYHKDIPDHSRLEAQAKAQSDYKARILSALESASQPSLSMADFLTGMDSLANEAMIAAAPEPEAQL